MDPRSEVLLRQAELFQGSLLLVGLPADDLLGKLPDARGWCWHAGDQAALDSRFTGRTHFGVDAPQESFEAAVLFLPKARDLTDYLLNALASRLNGRELFLVGEKRGGIEAAARQLSPFGRARKLDSARHCQLWQVTVENAPQAVTLDSLAKPYRIQPWPPGPGLGAAAGKHRQAAQWPSAGLRVRCRCAGGCGQTPLPA
jgi:16S rRNA (guanine1207-N2)-methyltransferase